MSTIVFKLLGALSGLILYWSVSPSGTRTRSTVLSMALGLVIATVAAPFTAMYLSKFISVQESPDWLFVAAALNGLVILPTVRFLSVKANKGEVPNPMKGDDK